VTRQKHRQKRRARKQGESQIFYTKCVDGDGNVCRHRVKLMPDGHIALLDHERGEPAKTLAYYTLSGERPTGCYEVLHRVRARNSLLPHLFFREARELPKDTMAFVVRHVEAARACRMLRQALRAPGVYAKLVRQAGRRALWVVSQDADRAHTVAACGEPAWFSLWARQRSYVTSAGGLVKSGVPAGAILWDATFPGVSPFVVGRKHASLSAEHMLVRLTKRLLRGWLNIIGEPKGELVVAAGAATSSSPACPGPRP
jgi:hypothetical protein